MNTTFSIAFDADHASACRLINKPYKLYKAMPERTFQFEEFLPVWLFSGMFLFSALLLYFLNQETISPLQMQLKEDPNTYDLHHK